MRCRAGRSIDRKPARAATGAPSRFISLCSLRRRDVRDENGRPAGAGQHRIVSEKRPGPKPRRRHHPNAAI
nr:hypothetical protein CDS [Bradyrhizobium sp.]